MLNSGLFRFQDFRAYVEPRALDNGGLGKNDRAGGTRKVTCVGCSKKV